MKKKNGIPWKIILSILFIVIIYFISSNQTEKNDSVSIIDKTEIIDSTISIKKTITPNTENIIIIDKVNNGDLLGTIFKKYNIPYKYIPAIADQKEIDFNFNNIHEGKKYKIIMNPDSVILSFHYQKNSSIVYSVLFSEPLKYYSEEIDLEELQSKNILEKNQENNMTDQTLEEIEIKNFLMGKFEVNNHSKFVLIDQKYRNEKKMYLQKETLDAFIKMWEAAQEEKIDLKIISATRNFNSQKRIWQRKFNDNKEKGLSDINNIKNIMLWSSMPSTSRHHWGTDIDINGFEKYFNGKNEKANKEYEWLVKNAHKFGFCQVYSEKVEGKRLTGYNEEKWHWSYMPLASDYLNKYKKLITFSDINGFSGSEHVKDLNIIKEFVFGIHCD